MPFDVQDADKDVEVRVGDVVWWVGAMFDLFEESGVRARAGRVGGWWLWVARWWLWVVKWWVGWWVDLGGAGGGKKGKVE